MCVKRHCECVRACAREYMYVGGVVGSAAERFVNPVHQCSLGFTVGRGRLKEVSATQDSPSQQY
jgi:hypothetical protein